MLAGMNSVATSELVAAVSNAGGIGTLGGLNMKPNVLRTQIKEVKALLKPRPDGSLPPFGVDLAIVQVGGGARKTNYDYTEGNLDELIEVICQVCMKGVFGAGKEVLVFWK